MCFTCLIIRARRFLSIIWDKSETRRDSPTDDDGAAILQISGENHHICDFEQWGRGLISDWGSDFANHDFYSLFGIFITGVIAATGMKSADLVNASQAGASW
jgi:hypothetical protein